VSWSGHRSRLVANISVRIRRVELTLEFSRSEINSLCMYSLVSTVHRGNKRRLRAYEPLTRTILRNHPEKHPEKESKVVAMEAESLVARSRSTAPPCPFFDYVRTDAMWSTTCGALRAARQPPPAFG
jgi:hypothetical protein